MKQLPIQSCSNKGKEDSGVDCKVMEGKSKLKKDMRRKKITCRLSSFRGEGKEENVTAVDILVWTLSFSVGQGSLPFMVSSVSLGV